MTAKKEEAKTTPETLELEVDRNQVIKDLVSMGEVFNPDWLDCQEKDLLDRITAIRELAERKEEIKSLIAEKNMQNKQLVSTALYNIPDSFCKTQSWAASLSKTCCSDAFKTFINSNKNLDDIKVFIDTLK